MSKIIQVTQKPVIEYSIIEAASKDVDAKIKALSLDTLEVSENSLISVKNIRSDLAKDFKIFEEQRKMVKDVILKPYNDFEEKYKELISSKFKDADALLKSKIDIVTDEILNLKINGIKEYFNEVNQFNFIKFDDVGLKIIKSVSDKSLKSEIDEYLSNIETSLNTIETLPNKDRVLAKFQMSKDLNNAISQTNIEIQREKEIEEQRQKQKEEMRQRQAQNEEVSQQIIEDFKPPVEEIKEQVFSVSFKVIGTKEQLAKLKQFMKDEGIRYE